MENKLEKATFAAGCFWHVEDAFIKTKGVKDVAVGYVGGHSKNPAYEDVLTGNTGHAEAVEIVFDPKEVSYKKLLDVFWNMHDPTTLNKQGADIGEQYRSAIFFHNNEQREIAIKSKEVLDKSGTFKSPVVTEITKIGEFYKAEEYHQRYYEKHDGSSGCHV